MKYCLKDGGNSLPFFVEKLFLDRSKWRKWVVPPRSSAANTWVIIRESLRVPIKTESYCSPARARFPCLTDSKTSTHSAGRGNCKPPAMKSVNEFLKNNGTTIFTLISSFATLLLRSRWSSEVAINLLSDRACPIWPIPLPVRQQCDSASFTRPRRAFESDELRCVAPGIVQPGAQQTDRQTR